MLADQACGARHLDQYVRRAAAYAKTRTGGGTSSTATDPGDADDISTQWIREIRDLYRSKPAEEIALIMTASCGKWSRRRRTANDFIRSLNLTSFVKDQNAKGLAPRIGHATAAVCVEPIPVPVACVGSKRPFADLKLRSRVQWVRRRCRGMGLEIGAFKVGARLPLGVRRQKVMAGCFGKRSRRSPEIGRVGRFFRIQRWAKTAPTGGIYGPDCVPTRRARFWARVTTWHLKRGPDSGPDFGPVFRPEIIFFRDVLAQAMATWRWNAFLRSQCPASKRCVYINMDETCIRMCPETGKGLVFVESGKKKKHVMEQERKATLAMRRAACSLVAFNSSCPEVAKLLPQVLVTNQRLLTEDQARCVDCELSRRPNGYMLRRRSAWVTGPVLADIIAVLGRCLSPVAASLHIVLLMDCCPVHYTAEVLRAAGRRSMHVLFVPSSMTGVLQPLDAYVFAKFKRTLQDRIERLQLQSADGAVANRTIVLTTLDVAVEVLNRLEWSHSFSGCGFSDTLEHLGGRVLRNLGWSTCTEVVSSGLPTLEELQCIFPRNRVIPVAGIFAAVKRAATMLSRSPTRASGGADGMALQHVWHGRLRSTSGSSIAQVPATAPASSSAGTSQGPPLPPPMSPPPPGDAVLGPGSSAQDVAASQSGKVDASSLTQQIEALRKKQSDMVAERKKARQVLRNTERKRRRLKEKAKALTDDDLIAVMRLRDERKRDAIQAGELKKAKSSCDAGKSSAEDGEQTPADERPGSAVREEDDAHGAESAEPREE